MITRDRVLELLVFERETGEFVRRVQNGSAKAGAVAGYISWNGYRVISLDGAEYFAHNLAWLLERGEWPPEGVEIDHKNRIKSDNRPSNHRLATRSQNCANVGLRKDNSTGERGVYFDRARGKYAVQVTVDGKCKGLGRYATLEEAAQVARSHRAKAWGEFAI